MISFIDIYIKVERNFPEAKEICRKDRITIGKALIEIAAQYGMIIRPCAEGDDLAVYGADCSGCMTVATFENALHNRLVIPKRKLNQRNGACACVLGVDIGAYDTCGHLCKYCYANTDAALVKQNMRNHNPQSPFLIGESTSEDVIQQFSMRKLAEKLGVKTASLYTHIESMEALYTDIGLTALNDQKECLLNAIGEKHGDNAIEAVAEGYRKFAAEHMELYRLIMQMPSGGDEVLKKAAAVTAEPFMQILDDYLISEDQKMN